MPTSPLTFASLDPFTRGYLECAVWVSPETEEGNPLDAEYSVDDLAPAALVAAAAECHAFQRMNECALELAEEAGRDLEHLGHDLFLSRNGHGTGYWDRDLGDVGDILHAAARALGEANLYAADDGSLEWL